MRFDYLKTSFLAFVFFYIINPKTTKAQPDTALADSLISLIDELSTIDPDSALNYAYLLKDLSIKHQDSIYLANAYNLIGFLYYQKNIIDSAEYYHLKALDFYNKFNDSVGISHAYFNLANINNLLNNYLKAIDYYQRSLEIDLALGFNESRAYNALNISLIYIDQEEFGKAKSKAEESLVIAKQYKQSDLLAGIYNTLAEIALEEGKKQLALDLAKSALSYSKKYEDKLEEAWALKITGEAQSLIGNYQQAEKTIRKALEVSIEFGDPYTTSLIYIALSQVQLNSGRTEAGLTAAFKAQEFGKTSSSKLLKRTISKCFSDVYQGLGDYKQSLEYYKLYKAYDDSIKEVNVEESILMKENLLKEKENQILVTKSKLQDATINRNIYIIAIIAAILLVSLGFIIVLIQNIRRKKRYNHLLKEKNRLIWKKQEEIDQQNTLILKNNLQLESLNKAKDKIFSILSHDLREPFNHVKGVLDVMTYADLSDEDKTELLQKLTESVDSTSEALDNLLLWSKNQLTGIKANPSPVDLKKIIEGQLKFLRNPIERKSLHLKLEIEENKNLKADKDQLEICLRNLLANAVKFSEIKGQIEINGKTKGKEYRVSVTDHGVGMNAAQLKRLTDLNENMSTPGTFNEKGTGLGILIVRDFMQAHNGKLVIDSTEGKGSSFSLLFPL